MARSQSPWLSRASSAVLLLGAASLVVLVLLPFVLKAQASGGLVTEDLSGSLVAEDLANDLLGGGITINSVSFAGSNVAAGRFTGGTGIIGLESGIILSTGNIADVVGPNESASQSTSLLGDGDPDLDQLAGFSTFDAVVLEFDFVPQSDQVTFQYVFASEEYNEYVGSQFNDVFAFYVNGVNCAVVADGGASPQTEPISINTINNGYFGAPPTNPDLYINNDPFSPDSTGDTVPVQDLLATEMDGLTVVLSCDANVNAGVTNTMKLAIADGSDRIYDAAVFIGAGSFVAIGSPTPAGSPTPSPTGGAHQLFQGDNDCDGDVDAVDALVSLQSNAALPYSQQDPCWPIGDPIGQAALPAGALPVFGDIDCDGDVDAVDALQILRNVAGLPVNQTVPCPQIGDPL